MMNSNSNSHATQSVSAVSCTANPIKTLEHQGVLNSASFSPLPPFNLLTTSQPNVSFLYCILGLIMIGMSCL